MGQCESRCVSVADDEVSSSDGIFPASYATSHCTFAKEVLSKAGTPWEE